MCRYEDIPDVWEPPVPNPYKEQTDLYSFLMDPDGYDQYCIMTNRGNTVQIMQNSAPEPTKLQERAVSNDLSSFNLKRHFIKSLLICSWAKI